MRRVQVSVGRESFAGTMSVMRQWLDRNGAEVLFETEGQDGAILISVEFASADLARGFRGGVRILGAFGRKHRPHLRPFGQCSRKPRQKMPKYRIEYVDHGGNVRGTREIEHDGDEAAIDTAHRSYSRSIGAGFDIWEGDRLVHSHRN